MHQMANESFQISDVRDGSRRQEVDGLLAESRRMYEQARLKMTRPRQTRILSGRLAGRGIGSQHKKLAT
jgi:hypothetical protein